MLRFFAYSFAGRLCLLLSCCSLAGAILPNLAPRARSAAGYRMSANPFDEFALGAPASPAATAGKTRPAAAESLSTIGSKAAKKLRTSNGGAGGGRKTAKGLVEKYR